ncbi:SPOR domain-containing protein [Piscinibacter gummiphilus]|uniref:Uncharacterized protein n=1 Tax=Piscinibacter gummiphilus TaxID=946333 RepID=A0A1W6L3Q7_9BURK|nr:SPOR domain-containing protein [Piscinibacter gummiphilus]ARN18820.1 hypothetical protein A4W93_02155 [Piscinibacter gummiphilus]ATU63464.1 hypothetical protein CPZ87_02225 [Piscinibacter gummiphilus]GLS95979.1 hypothetical protein GCM10007918_32710 [Piscinibacter gummiphilus]
MKNQRGGFFLGLIVGLLVGLSLALGVALYIAKVPVPFVNKVPQRSAEQDAAEAEKNKNWDPNSGLSTRAPARPSASSSGVVPPLPSIVPSAPVAVPPASAPQSTRDPAAILDGKPATPAAAASSTKSPSDPLITYFVQAGAFGKAEDAEAQRGKLAMLGMTARVTEREQSGRTVFRVRLGPFEKKEDAVSAKERLDGAGVESALIQVQR